MTDRARKDLDRLRDLRESAVNELFIFEREPFKGHALSGGLRGARALEMSFGGVAYRAAYIVLMHKQLCRGRSSRGVLRKGRDAGEGS